MDVENAGHLYGTSTAEVLSSLKAKRRAILSFLITHLPDYCSGPSTPRR